MNNPSTKQFDDRDGDSTQFREEWLSAYLDDELTAAQREIVEQRIAIDAETTLLLRDLERVRGLVSHLPSWHGRILEVPLTGLASPQLADFELPDSELPDSQRPATRQPEADFHDELQPLVEQVSPLGSTDMPSVKIPASTQAASRGSQRWWRPLAMVAGLLFAVGLGVLLWPEATPWSVATSTRVDDAPGGSEGVLPQSSMPEDAAATSAAARSGMESQSAPTEPSAATAAGSAGDAAAQDDSNHAVDRFQPPGDLSGAGNSAAGNSAAGNSTAGNSTAGNSTAGNSAAGNSTTQSPAEFRLQGEGMLRSRSLPDVEHRRSDLAPTAQSTEALSSRESQRNSQADMATLGATAPAAESSLKSQSLAQEPRTLSKSAPVQPTLQLAHSTAWQEAELNAGLARLAPLLNLAPARQTQAPPAAQPTQLSSPPGSDTQIPIAMASLPAAATDANQLAELLQQSGVSLVGSTVTTAASNFEGLAPYGTDNSQTDSTVALFVNRGQAEKILQAAQQSGQLRAPPIWIRSAASSDAASNDDQQVIVVLAPQ